MTFFTSKLYDSTSFAPYYNGQFNYFFYNSGNYLIMHDQTYPTGFNQTYVDVYPTPNVSTVSTVNLQFDPWTSLTLQPWTNLRGGYVLGDTTRHKINLILNGGNICMYPVFEIMFNEGDQFTYKKGHVDLEGSNSCFQFLRGASLNVSRNAVFHYGHPGTGILLLREGATINIAENAEMIIHNNLIFLENNYATMPGQIYMTLNEGSKLTFANGSRIKNDWSINKAMKLNVYMKGGILDDSGLPDSDKLKINRIYDSPADELADNFRISQRPRCCGSRTIRGPDWPT
jgi:hypothetical protein